MSMIEIIKRMYRKIKADKGGSDLPWTCLLRDRPDIRCINPEIDCENCRIYNEYEYKGGKPDDN